jgi:hypothetical protein
VFLKKRKILQREFSSTPQSWVPQCSYGIQINRTHMSGKQKALKKQLSSLVSNLENTLPPVLSKDRINAVINVPEMVTR